MVDSVREIKDDLGIPEDMRSCHTSLVGNYYVEGHVPLAAVQKLLEEQPDIDGIAMPGMPQGAPGMSGEKDGPWVIYSISDSGIEEFMTI